MKSYKIIRFFKDGAFEDVASGLSLEAAQRHCKDPATKGDDFFDGYEEYDFTRELSEDRVGPVGYDDGF
jgi:hypothetical protein